MFEVWLQMSDTNIDRGNPSDLPALIIRKCTEIEWYLNHSTLEDIF